jgi:D-apiose dehydrogenase
MFIRRFTILHADAADRIGGMALLGTGAGMIDKGRPQLGGVIGCGYFAQNHMHAWAEVNGAAIAAVCDRDEQRARQTAETFGIQHVYNDPVAMLREQPLDFVDVVTRVDTHRELVELAAAHGRHVICQKPLAPSLADADAMVAACQQADVRFMVHENFRWQQPMQALRQAAAEIGTLHFGRVSFRSIRDIYTNQTYLAQDERLIIYDLGVHLLDLARFFMGEVDRLFCHTRRVNPRIKGEDTATILLTHNSGAASVVEISYFSKLERELFPQTLVHLEGDRGSATLGADFQITVVQDGQIRKLHAPPRKHDWATKPAELVQDSVVTIQQHWADCLHRGCEPETSGADNVRTLALVFEAYESADLGEARIIQ